MKQKKLYLAGGVVLAALVVAAGMAYLTIWEVVFFMMLFGCAGVVGIILMLVGWAGLRNRANPAPAVWRAKQGLLLVGVFLALQIAYLPLSILFRGMEINRTQQYVQMLIPRLEEYKRLHHTYPERIDMVLTGKEAVPQLLKSQGNHYDNRQYYFLKDGAYSFSFFAPDGFIGFQYQYCCGANGTWKVED